MTIITLLTDFGSKDTFVGVMKGVIWRIAPQVQIADLTHAIGPQNVLEGALALGISAHFFPHGTVHLAVVDPGVGTPRRPIAARVGAHFFIGPDNGLFTAIFEKAEQENQPFEIIHLNQPKYWLSGVSHSFHGRDIFAPCAAYLANGTLLQALGTPVNDPVRLALPRPERTSDGWRCQVVRIDAFGNLGTNLPGDLLPAQREGIRVTLRDHPIQGVVQTYAERAAGDLAAMIDSSNNLSIAVVNGNAAQSLRAKVGDVVTVTIGAQE